MAVCRDAGAACDSLITIEFVGSLKVSNIKNLVSLQDSRLLGLKSHDCHTKAQDDVRTTQNS